MPKRIRISISYPHLEDIAKKFTGRLIGVVDDQECRAVLNVEGAARNISTAESINLDNIRLISGKRFVVVTTDYSKDQSKVVFISPKINHMTCRNSAKVTIHCRGGNDYTMEEV